MGSWRNLLEGKMGSLLSGRFKDPAEENDEQELEFEQLLYDKISAESNGRG